MHRTRRPWDLGVLAFLAVVAAMIVRPGVVDHTERRHLRCPSTVETMSVAATATLAVTGWAAATGSPLLVASVVLFAAVGSAIWRRGTRTDPSPHGSADDRARRAARARDHRPPASQDDIGQRLGPLVATWSDDQICLAWLASYRRLESDDPRVLAAAVWERQLYLDEIANRHPHGFTLWLGANPRAGSDPHRFLVSPPRPRPPDPTI